MVSSRFFKRHFNIDKRLHRSAGMVAHIRNAPVGKIVKRAVKAPDLRRTETDLLDNAAVAGNRNIITDVDLFFQKDKNPVTMSLTSP